MRFAGNAIWFVLGGWYLGLFWALGSVLTALSVLGLPISRAAWEMARMSAFPFGKDVVHVRELDGKGVTATTALTGMIGLIANVLWACTFGMLLFISHLLAGIAACIFIITIPFGIQSFKLAGLSFWPVGRRVVTREIAEAARRRNAEAALADMRPANSAVVVS